MGNSTSLTYTLFNTEIEYEVDIIIKTILDKSTRKEINIHDLIDVIKGNPIQYITYSEKHNTNLLTVLCKYFGNNTDAIKLLLENGANINQVSKGKSSVLTHLCKYFGNNTDAIKLLLDNGASVNPRRQEISSALMRLCQYFGNNTDAIKLLLDNNAEVNHLNKHGSSALTLLCQYFGNNTDAIKLLLDRGAHVNQIATGDCSSGMQMNWTLHQMSSANYSSLMFLCHYHGDNNEAIKLLLDRGASVHHKTGDMNPLMLLSTYYADNMEMIKIISDLM